jgi:hypothetical protein
MARKRKKKVGLYQFFITLPDRFYPFASTVGGKRVRGSRSYNHELERMIRRRGKGSFGYKLIAYRQVFHLFGALLFILVATFVSKRFFGSDVALYILLFSAVALVTFQEFYLHPRRYHQHLPKGVIDWLAWVVPIGVFVLMHVS